MDKQRRISSNQLSSREPLAAEDIPLVVSMLHDVFANRTGLLDRKRNWALGERRPDTLPAKTGESEYTDRASTRQWRKLRKWVESANSAGVKY